MLDISYGSAKNMLIIYLGTVVKYLRCIYYPQHHLKAQHWKYNLHLNTDELLTNGFDDLWYQADFVWSHTLSSSPQYLEVWEGRDWRLLQVRF